MLNHKTIQKQVSIEGIGLHTGKTCSITITPVDSLTGIVFSNGEKRFKTDISKVVSTTRCTTLGIEGFSVSTVEHLMAALGALQINNVEIMVQGGEIPILDGSAAPFVQQLQAAGTQEIAGEYDPYIIDEYNEIVDEETGAKYTLLPSDALELEVMIQYDNPTIGYQYAKYNQATSFENEIATARTFALLSEVKELQSKGLIKGGSLENAVVISDDIREDVEWDGKKYKVQSDGAINALRFPNEPARHKLLDLCGDLALLGRPIQGRIIAHRPGHHGNVELVKVLKKRYLEQKKLKGKPKYDPTIAPVYDINQVSDMLPHRYPFILVDKIIELTETYIVGVKNVTINEAFFQGHFPGNPIFPGVLQMEAMAQTGGILVLSTVEDPHNWDTYFMKMDGVKFKQKVIPGDTMIIKMELLEPVRRGIVHMLGRSYVGNKLVSEGELTAQIVKTRNDE